MAEMDQGVKRLVQSHPRDILAFVLPGAEYLDALPVDVATERQQMLDNLLRVRYQGVECVVDLEAEAQARPDMGVRCYEYGMRARLVTGLPVLSVVLWLEAGGAAPQSPFVDRVGERVTATWNFTGIELYKLPAETILGSGLPGLLPLVAFTSQRSDLAIIERAARLAQEQAATREEATELETLLAVFATRTFGIAAVRDLLRRVLVNTEIIETSALYQEMVAKGREEGSAEALRLVLRGRFGEVAPELQDAITAASVAAIHDALLHATSDSQAETLARLSSH